MRTVSTTTFSTCPTGQMIPLKIRSMVGLIPLYAVETLEPDLLAQVPEFKAQAGVVSELSARPGRAGFALAGAALRPTPSALAAAWQPHEETAAANAG